jgi:glycosyltransferase involved in cell wall biosynthesis
MRVLLLRNFHESQNLSMKLYADRLGTALRDECTVEDFRPWPAMNGNTALPWPVRKGIDYGVRFVGYPISLIGREADVFHVVDHGNAHLLSWVPRKRAVVTCHDLMLLKLARGDLNGVQKPPWVATRMLRFAADHLRDAAAIIAASQSTAEDLVELLANPREKIHVIHHGVEGFAPPSDDRVRVQAREHFGLTQGPVLLHVGNNWFYKNLEGLMRAFAMLREQPCMRRAVLLRVGKPLTREQHHLARSLGITEAIRELGPLEAEDLQRAYWAADVLVFPSLWEGFGWPPLEAMASGTPVVCSHAGALAEITGDAAEIVPPNRPEDIAAGIYRVLENASVRQARICRGLERARQFTWKKTAVRVLQVYAELAANGHGGQ